MQYLQHLKAIKVTGDRELLRLEDCVISDDV